MARRPRPPLPRFRRRSPPPTPWLIRGLAFVWRWLNRLLFAVLVLVLCGLIGLIGLYFYYGRDLPRQN